MNNSENLTFNGGEMGAGSEEYSRLGDEAGDQPTFDERKAERDRYRQLAEATRSGGNEELANRLEEYAEGIHSELIEESNREAIQYAREAWREATEEGKSEAYIDIVFPGLPFSDARLKAIREELVRPELQKNATLERVSKPDDPDKPSVIYRVPLENDIDYVETYSEKLESTMIELHKRPEKE